MEGNIMFDRVRAYWENSKTIARSLMRKEKGSSGIMNNLVIAVISIVVAVALVPVVLNSVSQAVNSTTNTTYQTLLNVIPIIFIAGILVAVIYMMIHR